MRTLVIAPHPDDEVLGVGGTLLRRKAEGGQIGWVIVTEMTKQMGWDERKIENRQREIAKIREFIKFDFVLELGYPTTSLDLQSQAELTKSISEAVSKFKPHDIFLPNASDVHSDHKITHLAGVSATKWFRQKSVRRIFAYETLSETGFDLSNSSSFNPNYFIDIGEFLFDKMEALNIYSSELGTFPFPRSQKAVESLAQYRGTQSGFEAAEAFQLLQAFE